MSQSSSDEDEYEVIWHSRYGAKPTLQDQYTPGAWQEKVEEEEEERKRRLRKAKQRKQKVELGQSPRASPSYKQSPSGWGYASQAAAAAAAPVAAAPVAASIADSGEEETVEEKARRDYAADLGIEPKDLEKKGYKLIPGTGVNKGKFYLDYIGKGGRKKQRRRKKHKRKRKSMRRKRKSQKRIRRRCHKRTRRCRRKTRLRR